MVEKDDEDERLRAVALQNAQSIFHARQAADAALRKQSEWLRVTLASIGDGVISTDTEGRVTFMNRVAESLTGWLQAEGLGQPLPDVFRVINEHTRRPVENPVDRVLREGTIAGLVDRTVLIAREGIERPVEDSAAPIRDGNGELIGCVLVFRDTTEKRRQERELESQERQFHTLAESIPQLTWMANPDGEIFWYNRRWYEYTGTTFEEMKGSGWKSVHDPDELPRVLERWQASIASGEAFEMVFPLRGKDQVFRPFLTRVVAIRDDEGKVARWFGTNTDIGEQRRIEELVRHADRRKDEFLATLAHELRNPLAAVKYSLEVMARAGSNMDAIAKARSTMERQTGQIVRLIDDLLDMSRINLDKLELKRQRIELASVVYQAGEASRPDCVRFGHELNVTLPPEPIYLHADAARLTQVFGNLLNNACKYTEAGGRIWLTAELQGHDVAVKIKDTGAGIPAEMLTHVFDLFTQLDGPRERSEGGLGIGLSLVKRVVEMHGGTVTAYSEGPAKGSEFVVRLPVLREHPDIQSEWTGETTPAPPRRILVVDDNRDAADSLALVLSLSGNRTETAYDGADGVAKAATFRPDVVLMDIGLPKKDGYEACRAIREQPWGKNIVLVALTGWGQDADRRKSNDAGFDAHMVKPVDHAVLMRVLASFSPTER